MIIPRLMSDVVAIVIQNFGPEKFREGKDKGGRMYDKVIAGILGHFF